MARSSRIVSLDAQRHGRRRLQRPGSLSSIVENRRQRIVRRRTRRDCRRVELRYRRWHRDERCVRRGTPHREDVVLATGRAHVSTQKPLQSHAYTAMVRSIGLRSVD